MSQEPTGVRGYLRQRKLFTHKYKIKDCKIIQKTDVLKIIKMAEYLSDLIPIIDQNSIVKNQEQLQEERVYVYWRIFEFYRQEKCDNRGPINQEYNCFKHILIRYFENHLFIERLFEELFNTKKFIDEQILVIAERYFDSLKRHLKFFEEKVELYKEECLKYQGDFDSIQIFRDIWKEVWNTSSENE